MGRESGCRDLLQALVTFGGLRVQSLGRHGRMQSSRWATAEHGRPEKPLAFLCLDMPCGSCPSVQGTRLGGVAKVRRPY